MGRDGRVASNEGLLRHVNDRIKEVVQRFGNGEAGSEAHDADFLCECGQDNCTESVPMSVREYEELRRDEKHFVVFPGHEDPDVETVAAKYARYTVVRKPAGSAVRPSSELDTFA